MLFAIWRLLLFVLFSTLEHTAWPPCCFRVWHLPRSQQKTKHVYLIPNQVEPDDKLLTNRGNGESRGALFWEFRTWDHKSCCPWHNWQRDNEDGKHQHSLSLQKTMQDLEKKKTTSQVPIGRSYELCVSCGKRNSEMQSTSQQKWAETCTKPVSSTFLCGQSFAQLNMRQSRENIVELTSRNIAGKSSSGSSNGHLPK